MASISLVIKTTKDPNEYKKTGQGPININRLQNLLKGFEVGSFLGSIAIFGASADPAYGSGTITLATAVAGNSVTIGQTVFTASASPSSNTATAVDWLVTGSDTVAAAALAAAINANTLGVAPYISATSALGVVTITCRVPGVIGNNITLSKSGAPITLSASFMTGGAGGVAGASEVFRG